MRLIFSTQILFFPRYIIVGLQHAMSDAVVFTSNSLDPSTTCLSLPITEPFKIASFFTSFTRHACLMFQRKKKKKKTDRAHMLLAMKPPRHAFSCHRPHVFNFKAYSSYLYKLLPEQAKRGDSRGKREL